VIEPPLRISFSFPRLKPICERLYPSQTFPIFVILTQLTLHRHIFYTQNHRFDFNRQYRPSLQIFSINSTMSTPKTPGLFFANSKITSPSLSHEIFTKWYNDVHIPDIFKTSGIKSGFRYYSTSPQDTDKPYLAIYPLEDVGFLETEEFWSIPVTHELLGEGKNCFEVAEFDTRPYELLKVSQLETATKGKIHRPLISFPN
jgi:hypothetical protein